MILNGILSPPSVTGIVAQSSDPGARPFLNFRVAVIASSSRVNWSASQQQQVWDQVRFSKYS